MGYGCPISMAMDPKPTFPLASMTEFETTEHDGNVAVGRQSLQQCMCTHARTHTHTHARTHTHTHTRTHTHTHKQTCKLNYIIIILNYNTPLFYLCILVRRVSGDSVSVV